MREVYGYEWTRKFKYEKYYEQLENMPEQIKASELPKVKSNLRGVREYVRRKVFL